jgi:hypothetical protein
MQSWNRSTRLVALALLSTLWAMPAHAGLKAAGPVSPVTTLPIWYQDTNGLALEPCVDQNGFCILTPPFDPAVTNPPSPITTTGPIADANFPDESFYFIADAIITGVGPARAEQAVLRIALEAAFLTGVTPNGGITFLRVNLKRMAGLTPGTYTVTYPYGQFTFPVDANGDTPKVSGQAFRAEDPIAPSPGIYFPPEMRQATLTHVGPFLTAASGLVTDPITGHVYVGNPGTPTTVTGSPLGTNFFRIDGPNVGGPGVNSIQTDLFAIAGRVFTGKIPLFTNLDRVTYARDAATGHVDAFVTGTPGAVLDLSGTGLATTRLAADATPPNDRFFASIPFGAALPTGVKITNRSDVPTPTDYLVTLVDEVKVTQADYDPVAKTLTIQAASRDTVAPLPELTAVNVPLPNVLDAAGTLVAQLGAALPPLVVEVRSSKGGVGTAPVSVISSAAAPVNAPPVAVADSASTLSNTAVIIDVLGNDSDPDADPLAIVSVTQPAHGSVTNNGSTVTYLPSPPSFVGADAFTYTIADGRGGSASAGVSVTVTAAPNVAPVANPDSASTAFQTPVTIAVLANDSDANGDPLTVTSVTQPASGTVTTNGTTVTFTPAAGFTGTRTFTYTVSDGRGGNTAGLVTVTVRPAETLVVTLALFVRPSEWRVSGTSTAPNGTTITIHSGSTLAGQVIGTATVTGGAWTYRNKTSSVPASTRISVESTGGAVRLDQVVTIK